MRREMLVKDTNYGMQALWDYVRKLGPLDKPKPREWVGLDDDDIAALGLPVAKARALEALLRRRNT